MWELPVYIAAGAAAFLLCAAIAGAHFGIRYWKRKRKEGPCKAADLELQQPGLSARAVREKKVSCESSQTDLLDSLAAVVPHQTTAIEVYTSEELLQATEDFSPANLIEGSVFHGRLNGKNLAIKRTNHDTISKVELGLFRDATHVHPNIIRLLGTCAEAGSDSFLVFEYARNGSLKDWLHGGLAMKNQFIASCYCFLTWNQRLRICLDVATALRYMHQIMSPSHVHRNVKSRNIFLDEEFNAKIGNFGMSECEGDENALGVENRGTSLSYISSCCSKGYLAPEYVKNGVVSPSIDIFAFGIVMLEALSGQPPMSRGKDGMVFLSEKIKKMLGRPEKGAEGLREWMDSALGEDYSFDSAVAVADLASACVEEEPSLRPTAGAIVEKLSKLVEELPGSDQFAFCESSSKPLL